MFQFKDIDYLTNGEIDLKLVAKHPADEVKGYVPAYEYKITLHGGDEQVGGISIRIGYNENIQYGGHIGYAIFSKYRGNHYAAKSCQLIKQVALTHGMGKLIITCNPDNVPSRKTCERIGATFKEIVDLPSYSEHYLEGERQKCIYEWEVE